MTWLSAKEVTAWHTQSTPNPTAVLSRPPETEAARLADWIALSDRKDPPLGSDGALLDRALFVLEMTLPFDRATVLLDHHSEEGWPRTLSIFLDPDAGLMILHRQGRSVVRHTLPGPLPQGLGVARVSFRYDAPARHWQISYEIADGGPRLTAQGSNPLPLHLSDLRVLCSDAVRRHPSVLWFGATTGAAPPDRAPWVGLRTPISTARGLVPAGQLRPGDLVQTVDDGLLPLRALRRMELPSRGSFAPVLLHTPYFTASRDILVSSDQLVLIRGPEVEYLFGDEEVLVPAGDMIDGRVAASEQRRAVTASVALDLGQPTLFLADGCALLSATQGPARSFDCPRQVLQGYEAHPLMTLLGRSTLRRVA